MVNFAAMISYSNPVWDGYCADPFVLRHDDFYYAYGTGPAQDGKEFVVLRSRDLVNWERLPNALEPVEKLKNKPHWAPEVAFSQGQFWMYYSADESSDDASHRLRVAVADVAGGPFRDVGLLPLDEGFAIDASPFCDPKTDHWFLYYARDFFDGRAGTGTAVVQLASDMTSVIGEAQTAVRAGADWQIYQRDRFHYERNWDAWHTVEGPFVVFKDERYYLFYAAGNWQNESYGVSFAVADSPLGPWTDFGDRARVLQGNAETIGPGHCSVILAPDNQTHICCYHAWNAARTKRQLCVDAIEWTSDGPRVVPTRAGGMMPEASD